MGTIVVLQPHTYTKTSRRRVVGTPPIYCNILVLLYLNILGIRLFRFHSVIDIYKIYKLIDLLVMYFCENIFFCSNKSCYLLKTVVRIFFCSHFVIAVYVCSFFLLLLSLWPNFAPPKEIWLRQYPVNNPILGNEILCKRLN